MKKVKVRPLNEWKRKFSLYKKFPLAITIVEGTKYVEQVYIVCQHYWTRNVDSTYRGIVTQCLTDDQYFAEWQHELIAAQLKRETKSSKWNIQRFRSHAMEGKTVAEAILEEYGISTEDYLAIQIKDALLALKFNVPDEIMPALGKYLCTNLSISLTELKARILTEHKSPVVISESPTMYNINIGKINLQIPLKGK